MGVGGQASMTFVSRSSLPSQQRRTLFSASRLQTHSAAFFPFSSRTSTSSRFTQSNTARASELASFFLQPLLLPLPSLADPPPSVLPSRSQWSLTTTR